jgi:hypothetical protein
MRHRAEPALHLYDTKIYNPNKPDNSFCTTQEPGGEAWQTYIPDLTAEQAKDILRRDLPLGYGDIVLRVAPSGFGILQIAHEDFDEERTFNLKIGIVDFGVLRVDNNREQGTGRRALRNEIELFRALGAKMFNVHACDGGAYMMARFGMLPDDINSKEFIAETKTPVAKKLAALEPLLTAAESSALAGPAAFEKAEDMWRLADTNIDIGPRLKILFAKAAAGDAAAAATQKAILAAVDDTYFARNGARIIADINEHVAAGKAVPASRVMLAGTYWEGHIDMSDSKQMARAGKYSGGWSAPKL